MYEITVLITLFFMIISACDYVRRAWIGKTTPVPATWILMMVMMSLSFWMYWTGPKKSWTSNVGVTSGVVNVAIILGGVIAANVRHKTLRIAFDKVQKWCLVAGAGVAVLWFFTDQPLRLYALVQLIALIAYAATVKKLWRAEKSTEPYFLWVSVLLANLSALYPAWVKNDQFAWIYLARAVPSTIFVIYLIARIKSRMKKEVQT